MKSNEIQEKVSLKSIPIQKFFVSLHFGLKIRFYENKENPKNI